jgi:hypothetical protein
MRAYLTSIREYSEEEYGYVRCMDANSQPAGRPDEERAAASSPAPENAVRSPGEIGGKRFRVGLDDEYVPFRNRTRRRRKTVGASLSGLLVLGIGAYGLVSLVTAPEQGGAQSACKAGAAGQAFVAPQERGALQAPVIATGAPAPKFTLNVYNATNRHGLAAGTAEQLKQRGFFIGQVTNDPLKINVTASAQVRGSKANEDALRIVAAEVPGAQIQTDNRTDPSVDLVLGAGFTALASTQQVDAALQAAAAASASARATGC